MTDVWNPDQYQRFSNERSQPFHDLLAMIQPRANMKVIDLGCGTGEWTAHLHQHLHACTTLGIDNSPRMLEQATAHTMAGLRFEAADIESIELPSSSYDLVFSNAALNWVSHHERLLSRLIRALEPGGQLAIQVPMNEDHPAYQAVVETACRPEFVSELRDGVRRTPVQSPRWYAEQLAEWGVSDQQVRVQIYGHVLESTSAVLEWIKGTVLTYYEQRLSGEAFGRFLDTLREQIRRQIPDRRPYFFSFARLFIWARK